MAQQPEGALTVFSLLCESQSDWPKTACILPMSCYDLSVVRGPAATAILRDIVSQGADNGFGHLWPADAPTGPATLGTSPQGILYHNGPANGVSVYRMQVLTVPVEEQMFSAEPSLLQVNDALCFAGASGAPLFAFSSEHPAGVLLGVLTGRRTVFEDPVSNDDERRAARVGLFVNDAALADLLLQADAATPTARQLRLLPDVFLHRLAQKKAKAGDVAAIVRSLVDEHEGARKKMIARHNGGRLLFPDWTNGGDEVLSDNFSGLVPLGVRTPADVKQLCDVLQAAALVADCGTCVVISGSSVNGHRHAVKKWTKSQLFDRDSDYDDVGIVSESVRTSIIQCGRIP